MNFRKSRRTLPTIEMTPLIDIIFQLVLFFMVTTTFQQAPSIDIQLPEAATDNSSSQDQSTEIWLNEQGSISIDREDIDEKELRVRIQEKLGQQKNLNVIVNADGRLPHKQAVHIIDLLQQLGVENISIGTEEAK